MPKPDPDRMEKIARGLQIMMQFQWKFPTDHWTSEFDTATEGFTSLKRGMSQVQPEDDLSIIFSSVSADWSQLLTFLASMYRLPARASYRCAIVECIYSMWKRDIEFRELLDALARQSLAEKSSVHDNMPWLGDEEWKAVFEAEAAADASTQRQMAQSSAELIREFAPQVFEFTSGVVFGGRAKKCFRCGQLQGYLFHRRGFGWRQRTHDERCKSRMCSSSAADGRAGLA
jgi:hypothetical protein